MNTGTGSNLWGVQCQCYFWDSKAHSQTSGKKNLLWLCISTNMMQIINGHGHNINIHIHYSLRVLMLVSQVPVNSSDSRSMALSPHSLSKRPTPPSHPSFPTTFPPLLFLHAASHHIPPSLPFHHPHSFFPSPSSSVLFLSLLSSEISPLPCSPLLSSPPPPCSLSQLQACPWFLEEKEEGLFLLSPLLFHSLPPRSLSFFKDRVSRILTGIFGSQSVDNRPWCISDGSLLKLTMSWQQGLFENIDTPAARSRGNIDSEKGYKNTWLNLKLLI